VDGGKALSQIDTHVRWPRFARGCPSSGTKGLQGDHERPLGLSLPYTLNPRYGRGGTSGRGCVTCSTLVEPGGGATICRCLGGG